MVLTHPEALQPLGSSSRTSPMQELKQCCFLLLYALLNSAQTQLIVKG